MRTKWDTLGGLQPLSNALIRLRNITFMIPSGTPCQFNIATDVELAEKLTTVCWRRTTLT